MAAAKKDDEGAKKVVLAPMVQVHDATGRFHHFYRGQIVPFGEKDELARLEEMGLIGDSDENVLPGVALHPDADLPDGK
jgi:hypothetical protein